MFAARDEAEAPYYSFQSGSYQNRPSWVVPLRVGFQQLECFSEIGVRMPDNSHAALALSYVAKDGYQRAGYCLKIKLHLC
jgi:hypothetical protein